MKQLLTIILVGCLILITGCSSKSHINESSVSETTDYKESQQDTPITSPNETPNAESNLTTTEKDGDTAVKENISSQTNIPNTEKEVEEGNKKLSQSGGDSLTEKNTFSESTTSITEKQREETTDNDISSLPVIPKATATDAKFIAAKIVEYINVYRTEQGVHVATVLPGLTEYAEYRSRQLVSNFAHDTVDERTAATALKYGKYIDPALYGITGVPYYTANAHEAIVKAEYSGSVDNVAQNIALLTRNSSGHWEYVGGEKYSYIAVGITYDSGYWYCDIAMTREDTDN